MKDHRTGQRASQPLERGCFLQPQPAVTPSHSYPRSRRAVTWASNAHPDTSSSDIILDICPPPPGVLICTPKSLGSHCLFFSHCQAPGRVLHHLRVQSPKGRQHHGPGMLGDWICPRTGEGHLALRGTGPDPEDLPLSKDR